MRIRSGASIPAAYQWVEYLESNGSQYIEIPIGFERTDKVEFDFSMETGQNTDKYMISPKTWNNNTNRFAMGVHSTRYTCGFGNVSTGSTYLSPITSPDGNRHQWVYENSIFTITDLNISYNGASNSFGGITTNLKLFYGYNANTKGRVYCYKHWKNINDVMTLQMYLIPCRRKSDSVLGLYDRVNGDFYPNNGSGVFVAGPDKYDIYKVGEQYNVKNTLIPGEYIQLDYLASTNGKQFIDTLYTPSYSNGFEIEFGFKPNTASKRYCLLSNYNQGNAQLSLEINVSNQARLWLNGGNLDKTLGTTTTASMNTVIFRYSGSTYYIQLNNNSTTGTYATSGVPTTTMYMFLDRAKRTSTFTNVLRIYYCIIYNGSQKVRHFIPCKRRSDSALGMYDLVNKTFYTNDGSDNFTQGNPDAKII